MNFLLILLATVYTNYVDKTYTSVAECTFNVGMEETQVVVDKFAYQFQAEVDSLFTWAYQGLRSEQNEDRDAIGLRYKSAHYDHKTRKSYNIVDILLLGNPVKKNVRIDGTYKDSIKHGTHYSRLDIDYSGSLLQVANAEFRTTAIDSTHTKVKLILNIKLGWFFQGFVTRKVWRNNLEWRLGVILNNCKEYAEKGKVKPKTQQEAYNQVKCLEGTKK